MTWDGRRRRIAGEIMGLRAELATCPPKGCACTLEMGFADWPDGMASPCLLHMEVNAKLDVLDDLAARLGLSSAEVWPANEPAVERSRGRGREGKRIGAWTHCGYAAVKS